MNKQIISILASAVTLFVSTSAFAKVPPLNDEAKAKAAEAAAKTVWAGKVDAYQLCKSQEKVAVSYFQKVKATGKEAKAPTATPACAEPAAFVYTPPEAAKPLEASGAHSPAETATSPPSSKNPDASIAPAKKP
jgi:hypothetical protein